MPAATWKSPASLVVGLFGHIVGAKARGGEKLLSLSTSPLALGQQTRASWGMDSPCYQFWTSCTVANIKMLTAHC